MTKLVDGDFPTPKSNTFDKAYVYRLDQMSPNTFTVYGKLLDFCTVLHLLLHFTIARLYLVIVQLLFYKSDAHVTV